MVRRCRRSCTTSSTTSSSSGGGGRRRVWDGLDEEYRTYLLHNVCTPEEFEAQSPVERGELRRQFDQSRSEGLLRCRHELRRWQQQECGAPIEVDLGLDLRCEAGDNEIVVTKTDPDAAGVPIGEEQQRYHQREEEEEEEDVSIERFGPENDVGTTNVSADIGFAAEDYQQQQQQEEDVVVIDLCDSDDDTTIEGEDEDEDEDFGIKNEENTAASKTIPESDTPTASAPSLTASSAAAVTDGRCHLSDTNKSDEVDDDDDDDNNNINGCFVHRDWKRPIPVRSWYREITDDKGKKSNNDDDRDRKPPIPFGSWHRSVVTTNTARAFRAEENDSIKREEGVEDEPEPEEEDLPAPVRSDGAGSTPCWSGDRDRKSPISGGSWHRSVVTTNTTTARSSRAEESDRIKREDVEEEPGREQEDITPHPVRSHGGGSTAYGSVKPEPQDRPCETPAATAVPGTTLTAAAAAGAHGRAEWLRRIRTPGLRFYRLRTFVNQGTGLDPRGRLPAMWCLEKGYAAACARVFAGDRIPTSDAAIRFLETDNDTLGARLLKWDKCGWKTLSKGKRTLYCNSYRGFGLMPAGSVVAMLLPSKGGKPGKGFAYFGFLEDNEIILRTRTELEDDNNNNNNNNHIIRVRDAHRFGRFSKRTGRKRN